MKWAKKVTGISGPVPTRIIEQESSQLSQDISVRPMGWALKTPKTKQRFEERVKSFLIEKFEMGESCGNKADPLSVSREMRLLKKDGKLYFEPSEWKTSQQIKSFFSRYSTSLRQKQVEELRPDETEEELTKEDVEALELEAERQYLRDAINAEIQKPEHPIEAEQVDICQLYKDGKLKNLKLSKLRSTCDTLELNVQGTPARKKSFINPIEQLVKNCNCQK